jgi:hypothetical protein
MGIDSVQTQELVYSKKDHCGLFTEADDYGEKLCGFFHCKEWQPYSLKGIMPCDLIELLRLHVIYGLAFCWRCEGSSECASADSYSECCN